MVEMRVVPCALWSDPESPPDPRRAVGASARWFRAVASVLVVWRVV